MDIDIENKQNGKKKWIFIIAGILILIAIIIFAILRFGKDSTVAKQIGSILPFGQLSDDASRGDVTGNNIEGTLNGNTSGEQDKPLFLQLAQGPVAGAINVSREGKTYVRYVLRENGFIYEVDPETGVSNQLTNTTIPRIYEAYFGNSGNTVILRYLTRDELSRLDVIKTYLANLELPTNGTSTTNIVGTLRGEYLPDNISALSISPDKKNLFYLLPIPEGVSGTIVPLQSTQQAKEVFRNSFGEWLPQLLDNGTVLLTTKASADVPGYSYIYDPKNKTLERMIREKNGLTTQANSSGTLVIYNENIAGNFTLGLYNNKVISSADSDAQNEAPIPLTTLPEKCAWGTVHHTLYCGAPLSIGNVKIPDEWYQGITTFSDLFWMVNTDTEEISLLADPKDEPKRSFDVIVPFIDNKESFLFFVDKNDSSLWSMRIPTLTQDGDVPPIDTSGLSPEELKDVEGSTY